MSELTREEIEQMKPGPALNKLIAEQVMGWEWFDAKTTVQGNMIFAAESYAMDPEGNPHFNWSPSEKIEDAWPVLVRLQDTWTWHMRNNNLANEVDVYIGRWVFTSTSVPEAIGKVALLAVMGL